MKLAMTILTAATMTVASLQVAAASERIRPVDRDRVLTSAGDSAALARNARARDAFAFDAPLTVPTARARFYGNDYLQSLAEGGATAAPAGR